MLGVLHNPYEIVLVCGINHTNVTTDFRAAHNLEVSPLGTLVALLFPGWAMFLAVLRVSPTPRAGLGGVCGVSFLGFLLKLQ